MVELIDALILDNLAPKQGVNLSFDVGLNEISYEKRYIFNFLLLRNQALDGGKFVVNNRQIVPLENPDNSLFLLAVNSQNIAMSVCFELVKDSKKDEIKNIQAELVALRDMPLNTNTDRLAKLTSIFTILKNHKAAYVLINKGNDINKSSMRLIELILVDFAADLTIITLDDKDAVKKADNSYDELDLTRPAAKPAGQPVSSAQSASSGVARSAAPAYVQPEPQPVEEEEEDDDPSFYDYVEIGGENSGIHRQTVKKPKPKKQFSLFGGNSQQKIKPQPKAQESQAQPARKISGIRWAEEKEGTKKGLDFHYIGKLMKKEWSSFLFVLYGTLSTVFFSFIVPYQFANYSASKATSGSASPLLSVIFLIGSILCFIVTVLIITSLFAFLDKETVSKKRYIYTITFSEIFAVLGIVLGYVLLQILAKRGILVNTSDRLVKYQNKFLTMGIILAIVVIIIPFLARYLRMIGNKIKSLFKKKNEE